MTDEAQLAPTTTINRNRRLANWLKEHKAEIMCCWVQEMRRQGSDKDRSSKTEQPKQRYLSSFYDGLVEAARMGNLDRLHTLLDEMVFEHVQEAYNIDEILLQAQQLRTAIHEHTAATESPEDALAIIKALNPLLCQSVSMLVRSFADLAEGILNERLAEGELMAQSLHRANQEANRSLLQLRTLYNVSRELGQTVDIERTLGLIAEHLVAVAGIERCAIWLTGETQALIVAVAHGVGSEQLEGITLSPAKRSFVSEAFRRRQYYLVEDRLDGRPLKDPLGHCFKMRSVLAMPLITEGEALGVITVDGHSSNRPFDASTIDMMRSVAEQAAIAIKTARLYDQLTHLNQELERRVEQRTEELERAMRDLEHLDRTKSDFISIAAHELKTPLTLIDGYTNILKDSIGQEDPRHLMLMEGIVAGSERLGALIEDMIDASIIDADVLTLDLLPASPARMIHLALATFDRAVTERRLHMTTTGLDELPSIECDAQRLHQVFVNTIGNSIKFTPDGGRIDIVGRLLADADVDSAHFIEITITDTGIGIDPQHHERIFHKFFQVGDTTLHSTGKTKFKGGGPGLGLPIARGIVEAHGGRIWVESEGHDEQRCPGSTFYILLPVKARRTLKDGRARRELGR